MCYGSPKITVHARDFTSSVGFARGDTDGSAVGLARGDVDGDGDG